MKCFFVFLIISNVPSIAESLNICANMHQSISWKKSSLLYLSERLNFSQEKKSNYDEEFDEENGQDEADIDLSPIHSETMGSRVRLRARVAYDGTKFQGWQYQNHGRTIQGDIESVLSKRFSRHVRIIGAGRTDGGVHSRGQAFHFDLYEKEIRASKSATKEMGEVAEFSDESNVTLVSSDFLAQLQKSMNRMLAQDIRVWNLSQGPSIEVINGTLITKTYYWHAMASAKAKLYCYRLSLQPGSITLDPLQRFTRVHIPDSVDVDYLRTLLKHFEGTHDFRAFAGAVDSYQRKIGSTASEKNTIRTIYNITLVDESCLGSSSGNYRIDFILKGALFKMVRNIVGTVLEVAKGKMDESLLLQLLLQNSTNSITTDNPAGSTNAPFTRKDNKCKPAAPEGLTLEHVFYDDETF